ncbi:MAG TPA: UDP-N-acetylmuramate--L-alanine ligase [Acidimicrobiales bacterium]|nr:UDP-N-acetylmuramate--L-alanine ligase [Acidimicrobiales bacterium]
MSAFTPGQRVHVVGVGGAGMSALAMFLAEMGAEVSGCDATDTAILEDVRARRVTTFVGHNVSHVEGVDVVLWSPAVASDHVELVRARESGAQMVSRAHTLYEISLMKRVIGLTGTHGKTTATSMMVQVALAAGRDDGWLVGAPVLGVGANGHWGTGDVIVEVDESYGTFGELRPYALGLLNVEADHLDHYGSLETLERAFVELVERTSGPVVAWGDDAGVKRVLDAVKRPAVLVGTEADATWRVTDVELERRRANFRLRGPQSTLEITLRVTGAHNVANAALVAVLAHELGVGDDAVTRGLSNFVGAPRRFQFRGAWRGADVYEDYAHLPGEITATLAATRAAGYERVTVVFQPHRVTRTLALVDQFASAFEGARHVIVTDVYAAGEANPTGVTGEIIADALRRHDPSLDTLYCSDLALVGGLLEDLVDDSDVLLILGAGDVGSVVSQLAGGVA